MATTSRSERVKGALSLLSLAMPQIAPLVAAVPQIASIIGILGSAFKRIGGNGEDYEKILADNQIDIDRLKNPDSFRTKGPRK